MEKRKITVEDVKMARLAGKPKSFETMVKFFLRHYEIPTRKDVERINSRMERIERLIANQIYGKSVGPYRSRFGNTASGVVLEIINDSEGGIGFSEIQERTGFEEKKLRNIVFRLNKLGKIRPTKRGIYIPM
jgi:hypothetical protein